MCKSKRLYSALAFISSLVISLLLFSCAEFSQANGTSSLCIKLPSSSGRSAHSADEIANYEALLTTPVQKKLLEEGGSSYESIRSVLKSYIYKEEKSESGGEIRFDGIDEGDYSLILLALDKDQSLLASGAEFSVRVEAEKQTEVQITLSWASEESDGDDIEADVSDETEKSDGDDIGTDVSDETEKSDGDDIETDVSGETEKSDDSETILVENGTVIQILPEYSDYTLRAVFSSEDVQYTSDSGDTYTSTDYFATFTLLDSEGSDLTSTVEWKFIMYYYGNIYNEDCSTYQSNVARCSTGDNGYYHLYAMAMKDDELLCDFTMILINDDFKLALAYN